MIRLNRAILLQTNCLTNTKRNTLMKFSKDALLLANKLLKKRKSKWLMELHNDTYLYSKQTTLFNSQVICDIERTVIKNKGKKLKHITIKFNIPRNCKIFSTKVNFFVELRMYPRQRIAVPIKQNRNYERYKTLTDKGWICKTYGLTSNGQIAAFLSKEDAEFVQRPNVLGIDVNAKCYAVSVLSKNGRILKQTYFGKDIWVKRKKILERREQLQSLADKGKHKAIQSLRKLKKCEADFVNNRLGEVVKKIIDMALKYNADIAIEDLKRFKSIGKKANKKIMRIPFYKFKQILVSRCFDKHITLNVIDSWHTSKWCSHCGAVNKNGHSNANYSLFKCSNCGQIVDSDRKASLAIAVKSLVERNETVQFNQSVFFQFSTKQVPVNGLVRSNDVVGVCAVHDISTSYGKPTGFTQ